MSVWDRVVEISNRVMGETAEEICEEVKRAGYKYYPNSNHVVPSFRVMSMSETSQASGRIKAGLIRRVRIGSTLREAYWAVYGNGPGDITPKTKKALKFYGHGKFAGQGHAKGGYYVMTSVNSYKGHNFIKEVADRHR